MTAATILTQHNCIDCDADLAGKHRNTKRCLSCSAVRNRAKDREKKRRKAEDPAWRAERYRKVREWHKTTGYNTKIGREHRAKREKVCKKCSVDISDLQGATRYCPTCKAELERERSQKTGKRLRTDPEYNKARKEYYEKWLSDPETRERVRQHNKYRCTTDEYRGKRRRQYAVDPAMREHSKYANRPEEWKRSYNKRRRDRFANDPEYRRLVNKRCQARLPWKLKPDDIERKMQEQNFKCGICGEPLDSNYHLDHILPVSKGGASTYENLQVAHSTCNLAKRDKMYWERPDGQMVMALGYSEE